MAAGDKLLLESGAGDFLDLDSTSGDDLLLEAAAAGGVPPKGPLGGVVFGIAMSGPFSAPVGDNE